MGASFFVKFANIFMHKLLTQFYEKYTQCKPILHTRLVDDIFILWKKSITELSELFDTLIQTVGKGSPQPGTVGASTAEEDQTIQLLR